MARATALVLAAPLVLLSCQAPARELGSGRGGPEAPAVLVESLALRFGPVAREPAFDALRPKLAGAALVPSRVFDDAAAWTTRGEAWRAVDLFGHASMGSYRIGVRDLAPPAREPGQYRARVRLEHRGGGRYEWTIDEELAVGAVHPADLAAALDAALRAAESSTVPGARAALAAAFPRTRAQLGQLLHLETLDLRRDALGATEARLGVRLVPAGIRGFAPRYASFLDKHATPIRASAVLSDPEGAPWWTLAAAGNLWTVRFRVRDGSLVPLEGAADRSLPSRLRATVDYATQMGRWGVGARGLRANVELHRSPARKALAARFHEEPEWEMPFLADLFLGGPLRYPFEERGSEVRWGAGESTGGGTVLFGLYRVRVRENWVLRWLGGMTSQALGEFRRGAEQEADLYVRECLLALRDDLSPRR
ncbi:MAG TPA: hypothetical protein VGB87_24010 [Vicinamibacteria bacterium]